MIHTLPQPIGIDVKIKEIQTNLYNAITDEYSGISYESYGRVYNVRDDKGLFPYAYVGSKDYRDVLSNDNYDVISFFTVNSDAEALVSGLYKQTVRTIFFVNLGTLYGNDYRKDEDFNNIVARTFNNFGVGLTSIGYTRDVNEAISPFNISNSNINKVAEKYYNDMQPFYLVAFDNKINYAQIKNC